MGTSHLIFAPDPANHNEGLMVDVDGDPGYEHFEIGLGRWATGSPSLGFNAAISGLTFDQFSVMVDELVALRDKYKGKE